MTWGNIFSLVLRLLLVTFIEILETVSRERWNRVDITLIFWVDGNQLVLFIHLTFFLEIHVLDAWVQETIELMWWKLLKECFSWGSPVNFPDRQFCRCESESGVSWETIAFLFFEFLFVFFRYLLPSPAYFILNFFSFSLMIVESRKAEWQNGQRSGEKIEWDDVSARKGTRNSKTKSLPYFHSIFLICQMTGQATLHEVRVTRRERSERSRKSFSKKREKTYLVRKGDVLTNFSTEAEEWRRKNVLSLCLIRWENGQLFLLQCRMWCCRIGSFQGKRRKRKEDRHFHSPFLLWSLPLLFLMIWRDSYGVM